MNSHRTVPATVSILLAALAAGCSGGDAPKSAEAAPKPSALVLPAAQRERIDVLPVTPTRFTPVVQTTGTVAFDGDQSTQVLAPISGPVMRIVVQPGTTVQKGDPLAYVSSPDFAEAVSNFRKADAAAHNAQRIADQDEQLFKNDAIARRDLEQAQTDAIAAAADREAALQQLRAIGVETNTIEALQKGQAVAVVEGVIRAPLAGTVVERLITPGQLLEAGATPCFTIADLSRMWVMANVFESDLGDVETGDVAEVSTSAWPDAFRGTVDNIAAEVDSSTKATAVRVVVRNPRRLLKKDMYVRVAIRSRREHTGLLVPVSAVLRDEDNQPFVYVQNATGAYERRTVTLGSRVDDRYQIGAGLAPGDRVVSQGGLFLQFAESQ
jgi:cobalt-zinc-cadmium efflux system membrane fusion protein